MSEFEFKCSKCSLCQDDKGMGDYICKEDNETEIDLFEDDSPELLKSGNGFIYRFEAFCDNLPFMESIQVDVSDFYSLDTRYSALGTYCDQEKGLDHKWLDLGQVKDGNGKWKDVFIYKSQMIGSYLEDCIKELDKAKAGQDYGKPFFNED